MEQISKLPAAISDEKALSAAMAEANKYGVTSTVALRILAAHCNAAPVRAQELEAARTEGWGVGFRDKHDMMVTNPDYRERVFNEILELDEAVNLQRFCHIQVAPVEDPEGGAKAAHPASVQVQEPVATKLLRSLWSDEGLRQLMRPDQQRRIAECLAPVQPVAVPVDEEFGFKALRLRRTACLLGLEGAIPDNDKDLMDCMGAVLGMICREVEHIAAPAAQGDAKGDRAAQRDWVNKKVLAMPDGMPAVIGPVLANTRCAGCNSFNAFHMTNCGYCGAAIAAKAASLNPTKE